MINRQDFDQINKGIARENGRRKARRILLIFAIVVMSLTTLVCSLSTGQFSSIGVVLIMAIIACIVAVAMIRNKPYYTREQFIRDRAAQEAQAQLLRDQQRIAMHGNVIDTRYIPDQLRQSILARDSYRCRSCGSNAYLELDHIIPVSKGGATSFENLQVLCRQCNLNKGNR